MKVNVVCKFCRHHNDDPIIEINFGEEIIFYICRECGKDNKLKLKSKEKSLPRIRIQR